MLYQIDGEIGDVLNFLPRFRNLKQLKLENIRVEDEDLTLARIQALAPPNLIKLSYKSIYAPDLIMSPPPPFSCIQSLRLDLPHFSTAYIEHFISGLPQCLELFQLN